MAVQGMRADARAGHKDSARRFLNYVQNANIIQVLKQADLDPEIFPNVDIHLLNWELSQLETECHPTAPCDQTSDIAAIKAMLEPIAYFVSQQIKTSSPSKP
jgi:hypothetical protein